MKKIKINFRNGETLIVSGKLELLMKHFQELENSNLGDKADFVWLSNEISKPYAMFNTYDVVYIEEVTDD